MSDDVRWVVQRGDNKFWTHPSGSSTELWHNELSAETTKYESELEAHRIWSRLGASHPFHVRVVRRIPAKQCWEYAESGVSGQPWVSDAEGRFIAYVRELPPEPSDRWELVPE